MPISNGWWERFARECLDFVIPINERHLRTTVREFVTDYNRGRPHSALGPGIPEPPQAAAPISVHRHKLRARDFVSPRTLCSVDCTTIRPAKGGGVTPD